MQNLPKTIIILNLIGVSFNLSNYYSRHVGLYKYVVRLRSCAIVYTELMKYTGDLLIKDLQKKVKALEGTSFTSQWQLFRPEAGSY